jgi:hypothetical protein
MHNSLQITNATALVNAGASLQTLMALLGHMSAEMSLRYGRLFDTTVRTEYDRALDLAKTQARTPTPGTTMLRLTDITGGADWKDGCTVVPARRRPDRRRALPNGARARLNHPTSLVGKHSR